METINIFQAKTNLSKLIEKVESGKEKEIIIARHGRAVARLTAVTGQIEKGRRIGVAAGRFVVPDNIDADNEEIARLFGAKD
jgi:antitoxin (DNA-binding transcriptional repressor) of toxin-antitoxin stability system